ncbi:MAG: hypothetical protein L3J16_05070 [Anaerolineales bacterium]|nr:hypothetical protein [Anaerolineales bacterium]
MKTKIRKPHPLLIVLAMIVIALLSAAWGAASPVTQNATPKPTVTPDTDLAIGSTDGITWLAGAILLAVIIPIALQWKRVKAESTQTRTPR